MIRTLFSEIVNPVRLQPLGLTDILDNTGRALDRIDRDAFFSVFDTGAAVQHFYEPFLQAFDPDLRKTLGVWYTPPEVLAEVGAPLNQAAGERPAVYLTNALTGWEPPQGPRAQLPLFPELAVERDAAERVKQQVPILVVIGNPPYNAFAGTSPDEEEGLVERYKEGLSTTWRIRKYNLDDLYVRFLRIGERRITATGRGIVCYISNYSYLDDPSFVVARQRFTQEFNSIWIDSLNGDSRETGKLTPDGRPDPSIFSTPFNSEGIRLGTAIGLFVRKQPHDNEEIASVHYRDFWGTRKREELLQSLEQPIPAYSLASPATENRFSFRPSTVSEAYRSWPKVTELPSAQPISGLQEMRRGRLMAIDRADLERTMQRYFDPDISWEDAVAERYGPVEDAGGFEAATIRRRLLSNGTPFDADAMRRYALYPLDNRLAYWTTAPGLWNRPRPELTGWIDGRTRVFVSRMNAERPNENAPALMTRALPDYHLLRPNIVAMPMQLHGRGGAPRDLLSVGQAGQTRANLSAVAREYLRRLGFPEPDADAATAELVWLHALAICYAPDYLSENEDGVKRDFPRVPLPENAGALRSSAVLGGRVAELLDPDQDVAGITTGNIPLGLRPIGSLTRVGRGRGSVDLRLATPWGYSGRDGVIMPGGGRVDNRDGWPEPAELGTALRMFSQQAVEPLELLGAPLKVFLNEGTFWDFVPSAVWEYRIGGYQVVKKWL